jgi:uncharacterized repeat protein (TIGR01451 family)
VLAAPLHELVEQPDPPRALLEIQAILAEKALRTADERKMDSQVLLAMRAVAGNPETLPIYVSDFLRQHVDGDQAIAVSIKARVSDDLLEALKALGAREINVIADYGAITARMPIVALLELAKRADVGFIDLFDPGTGPYIPPPEEMQQRLALLPAPLPQIGSATSQGVVAHAADKVHNTGINGTGVKVCVLSDGVNSLAARQASGDLPVTVDVVAGQAGNGDEGTAMLEIIHDMAPGAALGFATALGGSAQLATNIQTLRNPPHKCDIIVDDWTYFLESPFQEGDAAQAVTSVTADGALYFSDAANSGSLSHGTSGTWEGDFVDSGVTLPVVPGTLHQFGTNAYDTITLPSQAASPYYVVSWSDPLGASSNDYDFFILDSTQSMVLAQSTNTQNGTQNPQESIASGSIPAGAKIVVVNHNHAAPRALRVDTERGRLSLGTNGNTFGHNAGVDTVTVAAVDVATASGGVFVGGSKNPVEFFSSDGPRRLFYTPAGAPITPGNVLFATNGGAMLNRVDLAAADGVTTMTPSFNPFFGTSAAAPHAAAIAALIKSAKPTLSNVQIRSALQTTALDIEGSGFDFNGGYGLVMADASVRSVLTPLVVTMTFSPPSIAPGGTSTLTITLKNNNAVALQGVGFTDTYPANLVNAASPNAQLTGSGCIGGLTAVAGSGSLTLSAATVPAGVTCTVTVVVTSAIGNSFVNSTGSVTTPMQLNSSGAMATLSTCTYALAPTDLSNRPAAGGVSNIIVTTPAGCPVPAISYQPWVSVNSVTPNGGTTTVSLQIGNNIGAARATSIVVADRLFLITQLGP